MYVYVFDKCVFNGNSLILKSLVSDNSHCNKNTNKLLIDFNTPLQTQLEAVSLGHLMPLVPPPVSPAGSQSNTSTCFQAVLDGHVDSDVDNNPFDAVTHQTNLNFRMLNDPFELVYQKAYHLPADTSYEVNDKSSDSYMTNTNVKEVSTPSVPIKTVTAFQDTCSINSDNFKADSVHSNDVQILEHLNAGIGKFCTEDSFICIEDVTDPTGHILSDSSCASKQSSAAGRRNESTDINITNTVSIQTMKNGNGICHAKTVENGQSVVENNLIPHLRSSCCNGHNGKHNCPTVGCIDRETETDVLLPSQEVTFNSNSHTDEEVKAFVASRISACIQNALGQTKLSVKENWIYDHRSSSHVTATAPVTKIVVPHVCSTHRRSDASSEVKKAGLPAVMNGGMDASVEALQMLCQQGNANVVNNVLASSLKTSLTRLNVPTQRRGSSSASADSYGELNNAFCTSVSSQSTVNISPDQMCDRSFFNVRGITDDGSLKLSSVSSSTDKCFSLNYANDFLKFNGALNSFGNELYCPSSREHKNVTADGRKIEVIEKNGTYDDKRICSLGKDIFKVEMTNQKKHEYIHLAQESSLNIDRNTSMCSPSKMDGKILLKVIL